MRDFTTRFGLSAIIALIVLFNSADVWGQARTVTGTITDAADGSSLPGATVLVQGTTNGTITDLDGNFSIEASPEDILVISFIGYSSVNLPVGGRTIIDVQLEISIEALDEIVVVGYGTQQKKVATGSISKVTAQNLEGYKVPSVVSALDGQVSGVIVSPSSGQPGAGASILIRGIGTNGNNNPLVVVDGLMMDGLDVINPADIESIDILKDAASAAIYGTRAANGVIIITTKKGSGGKSSFSYEGFTSISEPWRMPEMLNSEEYIELTREKYANGGQTNALNTLGFPQVGDPTTSTDWMKTIVNPASVVNHRVSATFENAMLSLDYWSNEGVIGGKNSKYERYAIRYNSSKKINDYITIGENMYLFRVDNPRIGVNDNFGTIIADAFAYDPLTPVYDETGYYGFAQSPWVQKEYVNPLSRLFLANSNYGHSDNLQGNIYLKFSPIKGLTFTSDFGGNLNWWRYRSFTPPYDYHPAFRNLNSGISQGYGNTQSIQSENYVNYQKDFGPHSINAVLGTTQVRREFEEAGGSSMNIPVSEIFNPYFHILNQGRDTSDLSYGRVDVIEKTLSYYGRVVYDFNDKYLFTASFRYDGSSKFGSEKRFGMFPAVSAGWVISEESFFPKVGISFMKLRASWGINGNDRIINLGYFPIIEAGPFKYPLGTDHALVTGSTATRLANPQLHWEQSIQTDIGVEIKFLDDRLSAEVDWFNKTTDDLLGEDTTIPLYTGYTNPSIANLGEFKNTGIEAMVSFRQNIGPAAIKATVNYTYIKNNVVTVPGGSEYVNGWSWPVRNTAITRMTEGYPVGHFVGLKTAGIFQSEDEVFSHISSEGALLQPNAKPGDLIFEDINGDGFINNEDITHIGSPWPKHIIGVNLNANWKGFEFSALLSAQLGKDVFRAYERSDISYTNYQTFWKDRWTETNPSSDMPRLVSNDPNGNQRPSDFYLEDGSFMRLRNIQLGYSLPVSLVEKVKLSKVKVYATANNLWTLTGYRGFDPEIGTTGWILDTGIDKGFYPANKTYGIGLNITM